MSNYKVANRYASALIGLSFEENLLDKINMDLDIVVKTIKQSREIQLFLQSPVIKPHKKNEILTKIFQHKISSTSQKFISMVINRGRADLLEEIIDHFFKIRDRKLGIIHVQVKAAIDFDKSQSEKLTRTLEEFTKKKVQINFSVDKSLRGGFVVQLEDTILDASLKRQLEILRTKFLQGTADLN